MPVNVTATTSMAQAIAGAQYAVHAVPVQHSRAFLTSIKVGLPGLMQLQPSRLRFENPTSNQRARQEAVLRLADN